MKLSPAQRKFLRGLAHAKKPVVRIGQHGVTDGVRNELQIALLAHELVKVSVRVGDRDARDALIENLAAQAGASVVLRVGNVVTLYRAHPEQPRIRLPQA